MPAHRQTAPQPVHLPGRPPRGGLAATATRARPDPRHRLLPGARPRRGGREARRGVLRRRARAGRQRPRTRPRFRLEPITWLSAIAAATERIGLIATASTTYYRARTTWRGCSPRWTTSAAAAPAGTSSPPARRTRPATSASTSTRSTPSATTGPTSSSTSSTKLWDSWEDDALLADAASGLFADTDRIHAIDHVGRALPGRRAAEHAALAAGPAGARAGRLVRGRPRRSPPSYAEAIFTAHQTLGNAQAFYADIKPQAAALGRDPDAVKILPGHQPVHRVHRGARRRTLQRRVRRADRSPSTRSHQLQRLTGVDLSAYDRSTSQFPRELIDAGGERGVEQPVPGRARHRRPGGASPCASSSAPPGRRPRAPGGRGHARAGRRQHRDLVRVNGAADGFNVMPPWLTGGFEVFADQVRADPAAARTVPHRVHRHAPCATTTASRAPTASTPASRIPRRLTQFRQLNHRGRTTMTYRDLGTTGVKVSPLTLGAMMFGAWGNPDHDDEHPRSSIAPSTPASTSSTPPTSTRAASRRRSSARRSRAAATTSSWPPSSTAR